jgi:hypothetical protein
MKTNEVEIAEAAHSQQRATIHGARLRTLEALFRHPTAHNLEWMDVVSLFEKIGDVQWHGNSKCEITIGSEHYQMSQPRAKDLTGAEVTDLRHFLERAGWAPDAPSVTASYSSTALPILMVVIDHHGAKIYRVDEASGGASSREIRPYDPHHFLHHLTHKDQSRQEGQRAAEDPSLYKRIAEALTVGGRIVIVGHGTGKSNAAHHLIEYLRTHHREIYQRVAGEVGADLSAITSPQLLELAEEALGRPS